MFIGCYGYKHAEACCANTCQTYEKALLRIRRLVRKLVAGSKVIGVIVSDSLCFVTVTFREPPMKDIMYSITGI